MLRNSYSLSVLLVSSDDAERNGRVAEEKCMEQFIQTTLGNNSLEDVGIDGSIISNDFKD